MIDLKECPFCGHYPSVVKGEVKSFPVFWIKCEHCDKAVLSGKTLEEAAEKWNHRPLEAALAAELEAAILGRINGLGIGPMGYGGKITALAVHIECFPAHIASLPVAVNLQCHSARHREVTL